jgi:hypothetical protein
MILRTILFVALAAANVSIAAQAGDKYSIRFGRVPVANAREGENVTGRGTATATITGNRLSINGSFEGLASPATLARLHRGVAKGARGPVLGDLTVSKAASGTLSGAIDLKPEDLADLKLGKLYVQIHSEKGLAPDGSNLWGWVLRN